MAVKSRTSIYVAIAADILIGCCKFTASFFTGSTAMFSEGVHSITDTCNGFLLLLGIKRSARIADKTHPFGYSRELYFWSFIVSLLIFALGGGVAIYEGIHSLKNPEPIAYPIWNYGVILAAMLFEGTSLVVSFRLFRKLNPTGSVISNIIKSKDPTTFSILVEDSVAIMGLVIAFFGIYLSKKFNIPYFDGGASILIGLLLLGVAAFLARETKGLLMGETANPEITDKIEAILKNNPSVQSYLFPKTIQLGPESIIAVIELDFIADLELASTKKTLSEIRKKIETDCPKVTHVFFQGIDHLQSNLTVIEKNDLE